MTSCPGFSSIPRDEDVWDALWEGRSIGRIAVAVTPGKERMSRAVETCAGLPLTEPAVNPPRWTEQWREALMESVARLGAQSELPGDSCPALPVPRFVHGQSQGICDLFGARVEGQEDGNFFVHPLPPDPGQIAALEPAPLETSMYWGAVEWLRYARAATGGAFAFRNPVITGPLDTANYLLGTTVLMEWVYTEPACVLRLLDTITDVITDMLRALREAAGGALHGDILPCMRGGHSLCSECRSIISRETYEQFEAPFLRRLGEQLGPYGIHSCGNWERTIPSALLDPNLRAMDGQVRENDLATLCRLAAGRVALSIRASSDLDARYTWPDGESYYRYLLAAVPPSQPFELSIPEEDIPLWNSLCDELGAGHSRLPEDFDKQPPPRQ